MFSFIKYVTKTIVGCRHPKMFTEKEMVSKKFVKNIVPYITEFSTHAYSDHQDYSVMHRWHYHDPGYGVRNKYYQIHSEYTVIKCEECFRDVEYEKNIIKKSTKELLRHPYDNEWVIIKPLDLVWKQRSGDLEPLLYKINKSFKITWRYRIILLFIVVWCVLLSFIRVT